MSSKRLYGIRGAVSVENTEESITKNVEEMCRLIFHENKIFAFYSGAELAVKDIVAVLRKSLPVFMIPSEFVFVKEFVLNKNGKIDRNVLKEMIDAEKAD